MTDAEVIPILRALSPQEAKALYWKCAGKTHMEIGQRIGVEVGRVDQIMGSVYGKFGIVRKNTAQKWETLRPWVAHIMLVVVEDPKELARWPVPLRKYTPPLYTQAEEPTSAESPGEPARESPDPPEPPSDPVPPPSDTGNPDPPDDLPPISTIPRRSNRGLVWAAIALPVTIILAAILVVILSPHNQPFATGPTPTVEAALNPTNVPQVVAPIPTSAFIPPTPTLTPTSTITLTATPLPTPTPTETPLPSLTPTDSPTPLPVLFTDDFSAPKDQWIVVRGGQLGYKDGQAKGADTWLELSDSSWENYRVTANFVMGYCFAKSSLVPHFINDHTLFGLAVGQCGWFWRNGNKGLGGESINATKVKVVIEVHGNAFSATINGQKTSSVDTFVKSGNLAIFISRFDAIDDLTVEELP